MSLFMSHMSQFISRHLSSVSIVCSRFPNRLRTTSLMLVDDELSIVLECNKGTRGTCRIRCPHSFTVITVNNQITISLHNQMVRPFIRSRPVKNLSFYCSPCVVSNISIFVPPEFKFLLMAMEHELILQTLIRVTILVL